MRRFYPDWFIEELVDPLVRQQAIDGSLSTTTKVEFRCVCGNTYIQKITNHINLSTGERKYGNCKECSKKIRGDKYREFLGTKKPYPQWFINELVNDEDKTKARKGALKADDTVLFLCSLCGEVYSQRVASHITLSTGEKKKGCPKCGIKKQIESSRKTKEIIKPYPDWFIDDLYLEEDRELAKTTNFYGKEEKQFYCKKHNIVYTQKVRQHIDLKTHEPKAGCPKCKIEKQQNTLSSFRIYPKWFIEELVKEKDKQKAMHGTLLLNDSVLLTCPKHGDFIKQVNNYLDLQTGEKLSGCPKCNYSKYYESLSDNRFYPEWFIEDLYYESDKERAKLGNLTTSEKTLFKCEKGHIYEQWVKSHIILSRNERNSGCPYCSKNRSTGEINIEDYIKSLGLVTQHRRFFSSILQVFELDIYIPDKNVAIEYNGSYYHKTLPEDGYTKDRLYHNKKFYACRELGIQLISIFDVDWMYKQDKVKQYLKDKLTTNFITRIYARRCIIKEISKEEANLMYDKYHLLGHTSVQTISYGLFFNNQLVSCMSFQKGRYKENKEPVWCLTRFVTKSDFKIIGGASRLLHKFEKEYKPNSLVSYSDNDYFQGGVYSKLGFVCIGDTGSPRYYWYLNNREIKREQCQLKYLAKHYPDLYIESLSINGNKEDYIMIKLGAKKVHRSGHTKWIKKY